MYFFLDEAGDFALPASTADHRVAVAVAVAFSDSGWDTVGRKYRSFRQSLASTEVRNGEPKWHLLTNAHREAFVTLLHRDAGISVTPVTLDLSHLVGIDWLQPMLDRLSEQPSQMLYDSARAQVETLYRQARNLSRVQHLRIYCWAFCIHQALYHAILFMGHGPDGSSWNQVQICIDAVQRAAGSRETRVFQIMLLAWLAGWTRERPFMTIEGIHSSTHPFIMNYDLNGGVDLGKLVRANLTWGVSADDDGLQIADLSAGAVYAAAANPTDAEAVAIYGRLMRSSSYYGWRRGPGLFSPLTVELDAVASRYDSLSAAMRSAD